MVEIVSMGEKRGEVNRLAYLVGYNTKAEGTEKK